MSIVNWYDLKFYYTLGFRFIPEKIGGKPEAIQRHPD